MDPRKVRAYLDEALGDGLHHSAYLMAMEAERRLAIRPWELRAVAATMDVREVLVQSGDIGFRMSHRHKMIGMWWRFPRGDDDATARVDEASLPWDPRDFGQMVMDERDAYAAR